jgi:membrane-bound metal-dependent hydrolase YbcI (DUF457 family)
MLGRHHLALSVLTLSLLLVPFFGSSTTLVIIALIGCAVGSLIPDADASDGAIFHNEVRGVHGNVRPIVNTVALIFPLFGYLTRYGIYKPITSLFGIDERHRGFLHTIRGILAAAGLTAVYVVIILLILARDLASFALGLLVFMSAYIIGAVLHLIEDTMTVSGVQPLKRLIRGRLRTGAAAAQRGERRTGRQASRPVVGACGRRDGAITFTGGWKGKILLSIL